MISRGAESAAGLAGVRVLITDDNLVNRTLASALVVRRGGVVTLAINGLEAIAAFKSGAFDIVLMDVQMPELDGLGATCRIRGLRGDRRDVADTPPVIALTAHAMTGDRERGLAAGMDGYLSKPIRAMELFAELSRLLPNPTVRSMNSWILCAPRHLDLAVLRETADADEALIIHVIGLFLEDAPMLMAAIDRAIAIGDRTALREAIAHALKGRERRSPFEECATVAALEQLALVRLRFGCSFQVATKFR